MNKGTSARKVIDIIDSQSYEAGYTAGYSDAESKSYDEGYRACKLDYRQRAKERKQLKIQEKRRLFSCLYNLRDKIAGWRRNNCFAYGTAQFNDDIQQRKMVDG